MIITEEHLKGMGYIVIFVAVLISVLIWHGRSVEKHIEEMESLSTDIKQKRQQKKPDAKLTPSNPEDYGMVITSSSDTPKTQQQWNRIIYEKIDEIRTELSSQDINKIKDKIREDPAKTRQKLIKIENQIKECEATLRKEPNNEFIKEKLERLRMLKAIAKKLMEL